MIIQQRDTAIQAFHDFCNSGKRVKQAEKVYKAFELLQPCSDADVSRFMDCDVRKVSARRSELGDKIILHSHKEDEVTKVRTIAWRVNPEPDLFAVKKNSVQKRMKLLKDLCEGQVYVPAVKVLEILNS